MSTDNKMILDWNDYAYTARIAIAEGVVLLENHNDALPLREGECVSVFGRIQNNYYKSGTGSGGMVNVTRVVGLVDGLKESGLVTINEELKSIYDEWEKSHPYNEGIGWGSEPWSQDEMPLDKEAALKAAGVSDTAIAIIGRTAGEDKDNTATKGAYLLSDDEINMLKTVREAFSQDEGKRLIVLLNVGGIIDMSFVDECNPDAVMYVWHGGMIGGIGAADVLTGKVSPSGRLTDTIAYNLKDYPSDANFGDAVRNFYKEDIYVGYRYFSTFNQNAVRYPFGYGLSYSDFQIKSTIDDVSFEDKCIYIAADVTNTGDYPSKEVIQVYLEAPQGKLGKPSRVLVDFAKTEILDPGDGEMVMLYADFDRCASYDDSGVTGHPNAFIMEQGKYKVYVGSNVRDAQCIGEFELEDDLVIEQCEQALAPVEAFERMVPGKEVPAIVEMQAVPLCNKDMDEKRLERIPGEIACTENGSKLYRLEDVVKGVITLEEFVSQLSDEDLSCIIRGEGMGSSRVTPGTAAAFAGVSDRLNKELGIPAICCSDGPSGMRLDCGTRAFSLPIGTLLGCTFNTEIVSELYSYVGLEMIKNKVDCLLGPGVNIHRHPLNGRNFEYFSEDPLVTGLMGDAVLNGLHKYGVTGTLKHYCGNNQEYKRRYSDSIISERALREIYLKAFEYAVNSGNADSIMTSYGSVNGLFTAGSYDLNTTILRNEWGFTGIVMTDWWATINERGKEAVGNDFASMIRSQNDLYMVCPDGSRNATGDNTLESLENGRLTRAELQRSAMNICRFAMNTQAMKRLIETDTKVEVINKPADDNDIDMSNVEFVVLDGDMTLPLDYKESTKGTSYIMAFDVKKLGTYEFRVVGSSELTELSQIPLTFFYTSIPILSMTFNGTNGEEAVQSKEFYFKQRFSVMRLYVGGNGLKLKEIQLKFISEEGDKSFYFTD